MKKSRTRSFTLSQQVEDMLVKIQDYMKQNIGMRPSASSVIAASITNLYAKIVKQQQTCNKIG